jgi:hypothetical protein
MRETFEFNVGSDRFRLVQLGYWDQTQLLERTLRILAPVCRQLSIDPDKVTSIGDLMESDVLKMLLGSAGPALGELFKSASAADLESVVLALAKNGQVKRANADKWSALSRDAFDVIFRGRVRDSFAFLVEGYKGNFTDFFGDSGSASGPTD